MTDPIIPESQEEQLWNWDKHPAFEHHQRTLGERAADRMRSFMGSWLFIFLFLLIMIIWAGINSFLIGHIFSGKPFDPYPYVLLNLMLSTLAGLQGGILLIAAKRADQIASKVAFYTLAESIKSDAKLDAIAAHLGVEFPDEVQTINPNGPDLPEHIKNEMPEV